MKTVKLSPLPIHKLPPPVQVALDNEIFPDEIKQKVSKGNVESIVFYAKDYVMQANYKMTYRKEDKDSRYTTYNFFMVESVTNKK